MTRAQIRRLVVGALLSALGAAAVVAGFGFGSDGDDDRRLVVVVPQATNVIEGQQIRLRGVPVGRVSGIDPVDRGRAARLELTFSDRRAWPVPRGARMTLRWGGTVSFANRYIALDLPSQVRGTYASGARFPAGDFAVPVEFDALLRTFDARTRAGLSDMLQQAGAAVDRSTRSLRGVLDVAPPALEQASAVVRTLQDQRAALRTIVRSGSQVLAAVNASTPDVRALLTGTAATFDAVADEARALQDGLSIAPGVFANVRDTLRRADPTLEAVGRLADRLAPGVTQVRRTAAPLRDTLRTVRSVGPDARDTLATLRRASPELRALLAKTRTLSPTLGRIGRQAVDNLECIRPYTPDIISFFTNWGDFFSVADGKDKIIRAQVQAFLPGITNAMPYDAAAAKKLFPALEYGLPRPPGTNAGQPWFLPQCGAGPEALDPTKDPESRWSRVSAPDLRAIVPTTEGSR